MKKKTLLIDRELFCDWFFDPDIVKDFVSDHKIIEKLIKTGKFTITADELLSSTGYLPPHVALEGQEVILDELDEVDTSAYYLYFSQKQTTT